MYVVYAYCTIHTKLSSFKNIDILPIYRLKSIKFSAYAQICAYCLFLSNLDKKIVWST